VVLVGSIIIIVFAPSMAAPYFSAVGGLCSLIVGFFAMRTRKIARRGEDI
jgi:hypothetical protein